MIHNSVSSEQDSLASLVYVQVVASELRGGVHEYLGKDDVIKEGHTLELFNDNNKLFIFVISQDALVRNNNNNKNNNNNNNDDNNNKTPNKNKETSQNPVPKVNLKKTLSHEFEQRTSQITV